MGEKVRKRLEARPYFKGREESRKRVIKKEKGKKGKGRISC